MALFYALTSKHLLPEKRGGEEEGKKERCSTINSPRATRCSLLVDHVNEESKRRRRVKRTLSGRKYRGKIRSMTLRLFRVLKRTRETRINSDNNENNHRPSPLSVPIFKTRLLIALVVLEAFHEATPQC